MTLPPISITESRKLTLRKRTQKMTIASSRKNENPGTKLEHDDSDSTICYNYIDQLNENTSNIHDEPVEVYPGSQVKTQEENAPSKIVTLPPISITESRKLTLRKRTQKLQRPLIEASTIQMQNITTTRHKNIKLKKSTKKFTNVKPSKKKGNSSAISKTHKFAITSHGLLRKK